MRRVILNALGPVTHIIAGLIVLAWGVALGNVQPGLGLVAVVIFFSLLPDVDSGASFVGRWLYPLSGYLEARFGHRTVTHTLWFTGLIWLLCWAIFPQPDWVYIGIVYLSHLLLDMVVGERGVPLFWPMRHHFYLLNVKPGSTGEMVTGLALSLALILPYVARPVAQQSVEFVAGAAPIFTPTPTPEPFVINVPHVYDPDTEILVHPGDWIEKGQLIADLATYRRYNPIATAEAPAIAAPLPTETATLPPTTTRTPTSTATWQPNPLDVAMAEANLALARAEASRVARPPSATEVFEVCNQAETMRRELWRDQIARDMAKAAEVAWEMIHVQEIDLDILEGDIATADANCAAIQAKKHLTSDYELQIAAVKLRVAEIAHLQALASPTPGPPPTPTATATLTRTPTATVTPTATPTSQPPQEDKSRVYSFVTGYVQSVRVESAAGNETTVEIALLTGDDALLRVQQVVGTIPAPAPAGMGITPPDQVSAVVIHVSDGDTLTVKLSDGSEETVRLIGVDTPETKHLTKPVECYGPEASAFTKGQLPPGTPVQLEFDAGLKDPYDRLLAYVWQNGEMLNRRLVAEGYAHPLAISPNLRYAADFERLAEEASRAKRGLWSACE